MQKFGEKIIWDESWHKSSNDNGVKVVCFATSKNLIVENATCLH
jgi:hypothetical protein